MSQMMKIVETLPADFIARMGQCQDRKTLNCFSGKTLLKIASLSTPEQRQSSIETAHNRIPC